MVIASSLEFNPVAHEYQAQWQYYIELISKHLKKVPVSYCQFIVQFLLVICLSFSLARLFWLLLPSPILQEAVANIQSSHVNESIVVPDAPLIDVKQFKNLNVFGKSEAIKTTLVTPAVNTQAAETHLNLTLVGVVVGNFEQLARAIISINNKQELYKIDEVLPAGDGVTLVKVLADRIIINNNGKFESLFLDQDDAKRKLTLNAIPQVSREESQKMLEWQADHAEPEAPPVRYRPTVSVPDQAITAVERTMSNVISMNTFSEGGKLAGFKISPGRDADKFKELGLQANDVITAINGWPMSDPAQILDMYQNLGESGSASVQIKRGVSVITVEVALQ